jgi:mono/diheme cytochrome c family protein
MHQTASLTGRVVLVAVSAWAMGSNVVLGQDAGTTPLTVVTRPYDMKELLNGPNLSNDARKGRALWLQRCAYCHDGVGQPTYRTMGSWLGAETVQLLGPDAFRAIIGAGTERMPGFRYSLQAQQINQLLEFLKTVGPEQKPSPQQLSRKSSGASAAAGGD